jgi:hypothetical protein
MDRHDHQKAAIPPYGVAIRQSIASGDLPRMRHLRDEVERTLALHGDVGAALEVLKAEIAKIEASWRPLSPLSRER